MAISVSGLIDSSVDRVWSILGNFEQLARWHPTLKECTSVERDGQLFRLVRLSDQLFEERLDFKDDASLKIGYSVTGAEPPHMLIGLSGTIALTALPEGRTRVDWAAGLHPSAPDAEEVDRIMRPYYEQRIEHLRQAVASLP